MNFKLKSLFSVGLLPLLGVMLGAPPASADTLEYMMTDGPIGTDVITFYLPTDPTIVAGNYLADYDFILDGITMDVDGTPGVYDVEFYYGPISGGLVISPSITQSNQANVCVTPACLVDNGDPQ